MKAVLAQIVERSKYKPNFAQYLSGKLWIVCITRWIILPQNKIGLNNDKKMALPAIFSLKLCTKPVDNFVYKVELWFETTL